MSTFQKVIYSILAVSALVFSVSYAYGRYIEARKHNLMIKTEGLNICSKTSGEFQVKCFDGLKREYIGKYRSVND